jgi:DNA-binding IclR family transcriptional regulator
MQAFAETTDTYVVLAARDGLDVVILGTYASPRTMIDLPLLPGTRAQLAYALTGSALIAALPETESHYLRAALEHKTGSDWPVLRQRISGNVAQVRELGFCKLRGEWSPDLAVVSTPLLLSNRPPLALSCVGRVSRVAREHMEREMGPRLVAMAQVVRKLVEQD